MGAPDDHWCNLGFAEDAAPFASASQTVRVLSEGWMARHGFCPSCGATPLTAFPANSPVADFHCPACAEECELKAKRGLPGRKIMDGAFGAMTQRLAQRKNPSLMVMSYDPGRTRVTDLIVGPRHFFTPAIIEPRKPLGPHARRAGWLLAVMTAVEAVGKPEFTLDEVYAHEAALAALYPDNRNVRPKIRQQLQMLRDRGWLEFAERRGTYRRQR